MSSNHVGELWLENLEVDPEAVRKSKLARRSEEPQYVS
jgi:hypothetical protein